MKNAELVKCGSDATCLGQIYDPKAQINMHASLGGEKDDEKKTAQQEGGRSSRCVWKTFSDFAEKM